jgi:hypothetical protein
MIRPLASGSSYHRPLPEYPGQSESAKHNTDSGRFGHGLHGVQDPVKLDTLVGRIRKPDEREARRHKWRRWQGGWQRGILKCSPERGLHTEGGIDATEGHRVNGRKALAINPRNPKQINGWLAIGRPVENHKVSRCRCPNISPVIVIEYQVYHCILIPRAGVIRPYRIGLWSRGFISQLSGKRGASGERTIARQGSAVENQAHWRTLSRQRPQKADHRDNYQPNFGFSLHKIKMLDAA